MDDHEGKVIATLLEQAQDAGKSGEHMWAIQKLVFAIQRQQDQIRELKSALMKRDAE